MAAGAVKQEQGGVVGVFGALQTVNEGQVGTWIARRAGGREIGQHGDDLLFTPRIMGRHEQRRAERDFVFVHGHAGRIGREFRQYPARLANIERGEIAAVLDRARRPPLAR